MENIRLSSAEEQTLHWDGILAVLSGRFRTLAEAKKSLRDRRILEKSGLTPPLLDLFHADKALSEFYIASLSGAPWGDVWYDQTLAEITQIKKSLRKLYVDLALEPPGRWRLGAEKIRLEERLQALEKDIGFSQ